MFIKRKIVLWRISIGTIILTLCCSIFLALSQLSYLNQELSLLKSENRQLLHSITIIADNELSMLQRFNNCENMALTVREFIEHNEKLRKQIRLTARVCRTCKREGGRDVRQHR